VEQFAYEKKSPPSTSYRQTWRRHRKLLSVPMILGAVVAAFFAVHHAKTYSSTASLWVDTTANVPSSVGANDSSFMSAPPAASEQQILIELLTTRAFTDAITKNSLLGSAASSRTPAAAVDPKQITSTLDGSQVLTIKYSGSSPAVTESVVGAVVAQLRDYNTSLSAQHGQAAVAYDTQQVKIAQQALANARNQADAYMAQHPNVSAQDPNYASLATAQTNAATQLAQANAALSQASGTSQAGGWMIQVIDPASPATAVAYGKKKMLEVILGGVFGGLLVSFLAVVALTPAKKEVWEDELPVGKPILPDRDLSSPLPDRELSSPQDENGTGSLSAKRRFALPHSSEKVDEA
jgi:uncharacterized protein involved in exopolysaccharide biosynthesis